MRTFLLLATATLGLGLLSSCSDKGDGDEGDSATASDSGSSSVSCGTNECNLNGECVAMEGSWPCENSDGECLTYDQCR